MKALQEFEDKAKLAEQKSEWRGGARRLELLEEARQKMSELKEAQRLNVEREMKALVEQHCKVTVARQRLRSKDTELENAREDHCAPSVEIERLTVERNSLREGVKDERLGLGLGMSN